MNVKGNGEFPEGQEAKMKIPERVCRVDNQTGVSILLVHCAILSQSFELPEFLILNP